MPESELGIFTYIRYKPTFPLAQGGVVVFKGLDNNALLDVEFSDYEMTMPWPEIDGNMIATDNGLRFEFTEPGKSARVTYESEDGEFRSTSSRTRSARCWPAAT